MKFFPVNIRRSFGGTPGFPKGVWYGIVAVLAVSLALLFLRSCLRSVGHRPLPDFASISSVEERKVAFFEFLRPYIHEANEDILEDRERLERLLRRENLTKLGRREARWLHETAQRHGIELVPEEPFPADILERLDLRLGIIPESMALAQAALESGWGTSRFAREGNNLFGIWCYEPGCGLVPRRRAPGATHEVAVYRSPKECFLAYIRNLNSNTAYERLWQLRRAARRNGESPTGIALAEGLLKYSQERGAYIEKVRRMIRANNLE